MKFHKLTIYNLASLAQKHTINFDEINNHSSLFAITGKTGSGKSTILNAISLALYNQVYKQNTSGLDYVTLGEHEAYSEIEFSVGLKRYRSSWKMRLKKKNGEDLKKPQLIRELYQFKENDYQVIDDNIEDITKLSFDQFCKTIILNQGQFAKLLTSQFRERKSILEKFYNNNLLEKLNTKLREQIKETLHILEKQQKVLETLNDNYADTNITREDLKKTKERIDILVIKENESKKLITNIAEIIKTLETYLTNQKRADISKEKLVDLQDELVKLYSERDIALTHFKSCQTELEKQRPVLQKAINLSHIYNENKKKLNNLKAQLKAYITEEKENAQKMKQFQVELDLIIKKLNQLNLFNQEVETLTIDNSLLNELINVFQYIKQIKSNQNLRLKQENELKVECENFENEIKTQFSKIEKIEIELKNIELEFKDFNFKDFSNLQSEFNLKSQEEAKNKSKIVHLKDLIKSLNEQTKKINHKIEKVQSQISINTNQIKQNDLKNAIELCKEELHQKKECPVCHSSVFQPSLIIETEQVDSKSIKDLLEDLNNELNKEKEAFTKAQLEIKSKENEISELSQELNSIDKLKKSIIKAYNINDENMIESALSEISDNYQKKREIYQKKRTEINLIKTHLSEIEKKKNNTIDKYNRLKNDLDQTNKDILDHEKTILSKLEKLGLDSQIDEKALLNLRDIVFKNQKIESDMNLLHKQIEYNSKNQSELLLHIEKKESEIQDYQIFIQENNVPLNPDETLAKLETLFTQSQYKKDKILKSIQELEIQKAENKSKLEMANDQILALNSEIKLLQKSILILIHSSELDTIIDSKLEKNLMDFANEDYSTQSYDFITNSFQTLKNSEDLILDKSAQLSDQLKESEKELAQTSLLLDKIEENNKRIKSSKEELKTNQESYNQLKDLDELIGRDEFRNYVLGIVEKALIEQTNLELDKICQGRYSIITDYTSRNMNSEFKIIDHYRGAIKRKVSTLSGGETFLVSLAMALALAELSKTVGELDTLFIDEGFGTLDEDSIEEVYELLNQMGSEKNIGLISHVKDLTTRIPVNIELNKNQIGHSQLSVILN